MINPFIELLNQVFSDSIGKIELFLNSSDIPETHLELNGQTVQSSAFPDFAKKILSHPQSYPDFVVSDTQITLPNWQGYYLTYNPSSLGQKNPDTMRKIKGFINIPSDLDPASYNSSAFRHNNTFLGQLFDYNATGGIFKGMGIDFDSSFGVEGQEGAQSPNVGTETAPKNIGVIYAIKAKSNIEYDNLIFKDINDFQEIDVTGDELFFLTDQGKKVNLAPFLSAKKSVSGQNIGSK